MAEIVAQTARLLLRTEAEGDQAIWLAHMNTPQVMAHLGGPAPAEKVAASFARMAQASAAGEPSFLLVALKRDGTLIGKCGITTIDTDEAPDALRGQVQIGWTLRADYWGQGYGREAAQAMLEHGFEARGLDMLFGQTSQTNIGSCRLMEALGMARRADLDYVDSEYPPQDNPTAVYALERAAWRARNARAGARAS